MMKISGYLENEEVFEHPGVAQQPEGTQQPSGPERQHSGGWQLIDSAPKDRNLLLYGTLHRDGAGEEAGYSVGWWDRFSGCWYAPERGSFSPTHWMPLPEPPLLKDGE